MCTVSYLPLPKGHFILTSNRDEAPARNALVWEELDGLKSERLIFPKDPQSDGTWIGCTDHGKAACLLNGANEPYDIGQPFKYSRGQIILESLQAKALTEFLEGFDLYGYAPFTLILIGNDEMFQLKWDGQVKGLMELDRSKPAFWSAVTLYPPNIRKWRQEVFQEWLFSNDQYTQEKILQFHRFGTQEDQINGFVMNRNDVVKTLSITSFASDSSNIVIKHLNLADDLLISKDIPFISAESFG